MKQHSVSCLIAAMFISSHALCQVTDFQFDTEEVVLPEGIGPTCIAFHDIDGDGHPDAVVGGRNLDGRIALLSGSPDGSLSFDRELVGLGQTDWVELVDLNGDGHVEIVMAIRDLEGGVQIFDGIEGGGFVESPRRLDAGRELRCLDVVDIDLDGDLDIVTLGHFSEDIRILAGDGTGHFAPSFRLRIAPWRNGYPFPQSFILQDLDGDETLDLATIALGTSRLHLNRTVDGRFTSPTTSWQAPTINAGDQGGCAYGVWADFDGDGRLSCLLPQTAFGPQWFALFELDGAGSIQETTILPGSTQGLSWYPAVGDFDGDGDPDVAIGHTLPGLVVFLENNTTIPGPEEFLLPQTFFGFGFVRQLVVRDLEEDGDADLVALDFTLDKLVLMRNALIGGLAGETRPSDATTPVTFDPSMVPHGTTLVKWLSDLMPEDVRALGSSGTGKSSSISSEGGPR